MDCVIKRVVFDQVQDPQKYIADCITVLECYRLDPMGTGAPFSDDQKRQLEALFLNTPNVIVFLCYISGSITGAAVCFTSFATFAAKKLINIHDICVMSGFRGQGLGRKLMQAVLDFAEHNDFGKVTLEVRSDNDTARKLYRSLGFAPASPEMLFRSRMF
ncbi:MAG: GNAT family N-acetyltransferase [Spirochaetales bacterium]|nr:GNAT family N-acetyltransferase [Spirochaetales bacterium]